MDIHYELCCAVVSGVGGGIREGCRLEGDAAGGHLVHYLFSGGQTKSVGEKACAPVTEFPFNSALKAAMTGHVQMLSEGAKKH